MRDDAGLEQKTIRTTQEVKRKKIFFTIQDDNFPLMPLWLHVGHKIMLNAALLVQK